MAIYGKLLAKMSVDPLVLKKAFEPDHVISGILTESSLKSIEGRQSLTTKHSLSFPMMNFPLRILGGQ